MRQKLIAVLCLGGVLGTNVPGLSRVALAQEKHEREEHGKHRGLRDMFGGRDAGTSTIAAAGAELDKERAELKASRQKRRQDHLADVKAKWGAIMEKQAFIEEMRKHHRRMARLHQIQRIAKSYKDESMATRARTALQIEGARHGRILQQLKANNRGESK